MNIYATVKFLHWLASVCFILAATILARRWAKAKDARDDARDAEESHAQRVRIDP